MTLSISKDDVAHIAHLARIHVTPKEVQKFTGELGAILDYVRQLQKVDTRGVPPSAHITGSTNIFRDDAVHAQDAATREQLIHAAPMREGEHVKVKAVFN